MRTLVLLLALAGCHHDPAPLHAKPGDLPPLPPASGTPVGYLIDSATGLKQNALDLARDCLLEWERLLAEKGLAEH